MQLLGWYKQGRALRSEAPACNGVQTGWSTRQNAKQFVQLQYFLPMNVGPH